MATEYVRNLMASRKVEQEAEALVPRRTDHRRITLLQDGRKALALRNQGVKPLDILAAIGGSRARMYKAMTAAERLIDPLLL